MTELTVNNRRLMLVEYPAIVKNVDKMLESLGGIGEVSKTYSDPTRRLEVKFRPDDPYSKSAYANRYQTSCLLLKVKKNKSEKEPYAVSIEGTINTVYKFRGMVDFQFLPMERKGDGTYQSLLDTIIPSGLPSTDWLDGEAPIFIMPQVFSRLDMPAVQALRDEPKHRPTKPRASAGLQNVVGGFRQRRMKFACFYNFEDAEVPKKPNPEAWKQLELRPADPDIQKRVFELFDERPLWTRSALQVLLQVSPARFKLVLPVVAYYTLTGPFRTAWVRLGFDPKKDSSTKPYQILDFRLKSSPARLCSEVTPKRGHGAYLVPTKVLGTPSRTTVAQTDALAPPSKSASDVPPDLELTCSFIPGRLPPYRQMFYHLCDIRLQEVQDMIHANDGRETVCHERDGWCKVGTIAKCRQAMVREIDKTLASTDAQELLSSEEEVSEDESSEDDLDESNLPED
ncbi:general transcription factor 3C polypeptide 5-like [Ornithodoros turicata]|uniref:general transcription factor 3C polypeptide 5-like n=1 Tax=Ornithodoros turicata TaxID=34597 RepID=UPI0031391D7B